MPTAEPLTPIREANDLDIAEEAAWTYIETSGWVVTPQLFFAIKQLCRERLKEVHGIES